MNKDNQLFWVNYSISLTWIKAISGWFPLLTMIPVRSQWGRYNLPRWFYWYSILDQVPSRTWSVFHADHDVFCQSLDHPEPKDVKMWWTLNLVNLEHFFQNGIKSKLKAQKNDQNSTFCEGPQGSTIAAVLDPIILGLVVFTTRGKGLHSTWCCFTFPKLQNRSILLWSSHPSISGISLQGMTHG